MVRRLRRWIVALLLLVVVVWTAPWIVAATSLRNTVLESIFSDVRGTVSCKEASFGWFSPVELAELTITDEHGAVVHVPGMDGGLAFYARPTIFSCFLKL